MGPKPRKGAKRGAATGGSSPVPFLGAAVMGLLAGLVYLNLPETVPVPATQTHATAAARQPTAGAASTAAEAPDAAVGASTSKAKEVGCEKLHKKANKAFRDGNMQQGLDQLMKCAERNPAGAKQHWDVAVTLSRFKDYENALSWMEQAIALNRTRMEYYQGCGLTAVRTRDYAKAQQCYERTLELMLRLDEGTWPATISASVSERAEDMQWIPDENPGAIRVLMALLDVHLKLRSAGRANVAYKVISKLNPQAHDVQRQYADFLIQHGLVHDAMTVLLDDLKATISERDAVGVDSTAAANVHGLLYFSAGWDAHFVSMARRLITAKDPGELDTLYGNCNVEKESWPLGLATVSVKAIRALMGQCIQEQGLFDLLLAHDGAIDLTNGFGFQPLHYAAMHGDRAIMQKLIDKQPMVEALTSLQHTALHLAVIRGNLEVMTNLILAGISTDRTDRREYTAVDVACLHRYLAQNVTRLFGKTPSGLCNPDHLEVRTAPIAAQKSSGWHRNEPDAGAGAGKAGPSGCEFDVRDDLSREEFIFDYLALGRPVLIRGALKGEEWDMLRNRWGRDRFTKLYGDERFQTGAIPFADNFGLNQTEMGGVDFVRYMLRLRKSQKAGLIPAYVFQSIEESSPIMNDIKIPGVLDPAETEIIPQNVQFYLGPAGSGAPMHFHRAAYNVLVHGRKRWAVQPPHWAKYSAEHPQAFFDTALAALRDAGEPVFECVQEAGDVLFIPDAWGHTTLNLDENIGYASEFVWGASEFSLSDEVLDPEPQVPASTASVEGVEGDGDDVDGGKIWM